MQLKNHNLMILLLLILSLLLITACGSGDDDDNNVRSVSGTVTFPEEISGNCVAVALVDDDNIDNGIAVSTIETVSGGSFDYTLENIPAGEYFLVAGVDKNLLPSECNIDNFFTPDIVSGDLFGYFGGSGVNPPVSANVSVPNAGESFNFTLTIFQPGAAGPGSVSGTAVKGPVSGGIVEVFAVNNDGTEGNVLGTDTTDSNGNFTVEIENYSGPLSIRMIGGQYTDEATETPMNLQQNEFLRCALPDFQDGMDVDGIQCTPLTTMAHERARDMDGGLTQMNINAANAAVGRYFDVEDILFDHPINPLMQGSGIGQDQSEVHHGMIIAAMSQYSLTIGSFNSSSVMGNFADDAADGRMDGFMHGSHIRHMHNNMMMDPNAGTTGLANAMEQFILNPQRNRSGLTLQDMDLDRLRDQLRTSHGLIQ